MNEANVEPKKGLEESFGHKTRTGEDINGEPTCEPKKGLEEVPAALLPRPVGLPLHYLFLPSAFPSLRRLPSEA